jgi:hypothetical protein
MARASFKELHMAQQRVARAVDNLPLADAKQVFDAVLQLRGHVEQGPHPEDPERMKEEGPAVPPPGHKK